MKPPVMRRSILLGGRKTSVSLEWAFWSGMKEISEERGKTLYELIGEIDRKRQNSNLSSAIRVFVLDHFRNLRPRPGVTHPFG
jgi:predicted DNA-binding ribbon-helix-helix protein